MTNSLRIIKRIICPKTPRANLGILYGENLSEPFNNLEAHTMTKTIRIIKKAECSKLLSTATGPSPTTSGATIATNRPPILRTTLNKAPVYSTPINAMQKGIIWCEAYRGWPINPKQDFVD